MKAAGYTLVELLVVLAIMGLLTGLAMPLLAPSRPQSLAAARLVADDLRAARQDAIGGGAMERVMLNPATGRYTLPGGAHRDIAKGVALAFSGALRDEIDFYPDGSASGGILTLAAAGSKHRVTVRWPSGQVVLDE